MHTVALRKAAVSLSVGMSPAYLLDNGGRKHNAHAAPLIFGQGHDVKVVRIDAPAITACVV
jgi:hypothetical protein